MTTPVRTSFIYEHRRAVLVMGVIGGLLVGTLLGLTVGPKTPMLGDQSGGDPALVDDVRAGIADDRGYRALSVARITPGQVVFAGLGSDDGQVPTPQTPFELGSITKTFTGLLLADAIERGEMAVEDPLSKYLPELAETPAGGITLFELATHSSGLPGLAPTGPGAVLGIVGNTNPYDISVETLLEATRTVQLKDQGLYAYSNLGMSLLGHAEARAAGAADWPTLARDRLLTPLGMTSTSFAATAADIPAGAIRAYHDNGWRAPYWYGRAYMPAGSSTWTTAEDIGRYVLAVLDRKVPGATAVDPQAPAGQGDAAGEIGLAWHITEYEDRELTWHNGGTAGFHTMMALDLERGRGVVVLGNTDRDVDRLGLGLGASDGAPAVADEAPLPGLFTIAATLAGLGFLISFVSGALRGRDRLAVGVALVSGASGLLLLLAYGPWAFAPAWIWATLTGGSAALAAWAVLRASRRRTLPPTRGRTVLGLLSAVVGLILLACVIYAV